MAEQGVGLVARLAALSAEVERLGGVVEELRAAGAGRRLLSAREAACRMGLSVRMVWKLAAAGELPEPVRVGGRTLWRASEVDAWIDGLGGRGAES